MSVYAKPMAKLLYVASVLLVAVPSLASAEGAYPRHAIRIVVPIPPGGTADVLPRLVAQNLSARWGQPVIIENLPGAALNRGAEAVAKAEPDGYTLLATPPGPLVTNQFFDSHLRFDPDAFVPVTILAQGPFLLIVRKQLPVTSLQELIAYAKANPGKLNFASSGIGSPPHLAAELLAVKAGIKLTHVPYKGLTPALMDVVSGQVDLMFHDPASTLPLIQSGQVKVLAVGSDQRIPELPNVPAIAEIFPHFTAGTWYGVVAPPKTPSKIGLKLSLAMAEALHTPEITKQLRDFSMRAVGSTPADTRAFLKTETERWHEVVVAAGLRQE